MLCTDTLTVDTVKRTREGYLVADARAARIGIQEYSGREVDPDGSLGLRDKTVVRVLRPESEVFHKDAIASFSTIAVTNDHPPEAVTSDNWRKYGVGETGDEILRDGKFMRVPLAIRDAAAIRAFEGGKQELSCGYTCDVDPTGGTTDDGLQYDAVQRNIRGNHVALVARGRAGPEVRIGDENPMTLKTITVDGIPVEVTDAAATVIATLQGRIATADTARATADAAHATALAARDGQLATKDAEIERLTKLVLSDTALDDRVAARADLIGKAKTITGDANFVTKGLSDAAIRKAVVLAKVPTLAADASQTYIDARFDILAEGVTTDTGPNVLADAVRQIKPTADAKMAAEEAHKKRKAEMAAAWN
jgi:hypothetical protein